MLEEDKDEEDEAEWTQVQMLALMQTHSLAVLEDAALDSLLSQGTEGVARVPTPALAALLGCGHGALASPTPGGTFSPEQGGWWSFIKQSAPGLLLSSVFKDRCPPHSI